MGKDDPEQIMITPSEHLNAEPILECLNEKFTYRAIRINRSDWKFELFSSDHLIFNSSYKTDKWLFRINIIK